MLLRHVTIENFRGIGRVSLDLDRTTVVIGENNSGKTSLLDVLDRCLGTPEAGEGFEWEYRDFRRGPEGVLGPIRVVLSFEVGETGGGAPFAERLFEPAAVAGPDGSLLLRVEFTGDPVSGAMASRFLDAEDRPLDVPLADVVLSRLRRMHPVLVVRLAQPVPDDDLEWVGHWDRQEFDPARGDDPEEAITQVYRRLTRTRGAIPAEEIRRGLQAARQLRAAAEGGEELAGVAPFGRAFERLLSDAAVVKASPFPGSGSQSLGLLLVLGALLEARGEARMEAGSSPLIAIEEPEVHLHPMLLSATWDVIQGLRAQTLVTTNSGEFLAQVPLAHLRRLVRRAGEIETYELRDGTLSPDALRRVTYHVRAKRGVTLFARCWILVEGETEFWLLQDLARVLGYDLGGEGVRCVEFAQCGVAPLVRLADDLGIAWHLLSDGDDSGVAFAADAGAQLRGGKKRDHVTRLERRNVEMLLWDHGFDDVFLRATGLSAQGPNTPQEERVPPHKVVERAVRAHSKPGMALMVAEECARRGPDSVPPPLRNVIETAVRLAREAVEDDG